MHWVLDILGKWCIFSDVTMVLRHIPIFRKCILKYLEMKYQGLYNFVNHKHMYTHLNRLIGNMAEVNHC